MRAVAAVVNGESSLWSVLWVTQQLPLLISEWHDTIPDFSQKAFQIVLCFENWWCFLTSYLNFCPIRETVRVMEESWKSFLPLRKMRRAQGPRANAPLCPRCHPLAGWAAACVPPSAPLFALRFCRRGPSGQQAIPSGPPACRSLLWASAACSQTSALGREPFTDLLTRYLALDSPGGVHSLVNNPQWEFGLNCLSLVTLFINTNHPQANLHGVPREVAADSGLGESIYFGSAVWGRRRA